MEILRNEVSIYSGEGWDSIEKRFIGTETYENDSFCAKSILFNPNLEEECRDSWC